MVCNFSTWEPGKEELQVLGWPEIRAESLSQRRKEGEREEEDRAYKKWWETEVCLLVIAGRTESAHLSVLYGAEWRLSGSHQGNTVTEKPRERSLADDDMKLHAKACRQRVARRCAKMDSSTLHLHHCPEFSSREEHIHVPATPSL